MSSSMMLTATIAAIAIVMLALWQVPIICVRRFQRRHQDQLSPAEILKGENETRSNLAQIVGGAAVLAGLYFTSQTFRLQQQGQITDRISKAVEQLASEKADVSLGGIHQVGRIAADSKRDHWPMIQVLMAHVERFAALPNRNVFTQLCDPTVPFDESGIPDYKVQAIVRVLQDRDTKMEADSQRVSIVRSTLTYIDFSRAELRRAVLVGNDLRGAILADADLREARLNFSLLNHVNISRANLAQSQLQSTCLIGAQLTATNLRDSHLESADLRYVVDTSGADFTGANLDGTKLNRLDLTKAKGLTSGQLAKAKMDCTTKLPADLAGLQATLKCSE